MYKKSFISLIILTFLILCSLQTFAQVKPLSVDEEIFAAKKRLIELNEKKIKEMATETEKLRAEIGESGQFTKSSRILEPAENPTAIVPENSKGPMETRPAEPVTSARSLPNTTLVTQPVKRAVENVVRPSQAVANRCEDVLTLNPSGYGRYDKAICNLAENYVNNYVRNRDQISLLPNKTQWMIVIGSKIFGQSTDTSIAEKKAFFVDAEKKRTDKQIGASSGASGTTSLVVKGGMPAILAAAVENGSTTSTIDGNTVTFRVNPLGFGKAFFKKQSLFDITQFNAENNDFIADQLKQISLGFSFDTTRGRETPALVVSKQQLSAFSVRYEFVNHRNPLSARYEDDRRKFFASQDQNIDKLVSAADELMPEEDFAFTGMETTLNKLKIETGKINIDVAAGDQRANIDSVAATIMSVIDGIDWKAVAEDSKVLDATESFYSAASGFAKARKETLDKINKGTIVTFEYTNNRNVNKPDISNFRFIAEKGTIGNVDLTFNASLTMFNKKPTGIGIQRIKDFDFALQADIPFTDFLGMPSTLSFAGRYLRQKSNAVEESGMVKPKTSGDIATGQIKFTIPIRNTGIKLPLSITFANRSELVKERFTKGNFGITFDLDKLLAPINLLK